MNRPAIKVVSRAMTALLKSASLAALLLSAANCAGDPGHFNGQQGPQRKSPGNADLDGPGARDVIRDVHRDRARQNYEDRRDRRYYGNY